MIFQSSAKAAPEQVFLPDFESTLQLVQVAAPNTAVATSALSSITVEPATQAATVSDVDEILVSSSPASRPSPAQRCAVWGPYKSQAEAQQQAGALGEDVRAVQLSSELIEKSPQYLIYVGPFKNTKQAQKTFDQLVADGVDAYVLKRGRLKNAVSVGLYAGPSAADQQRQRVQSLGYNVLQTTRKRMRRVHHVSAWIVDDGQRRAGETTVAAAAPCAAATTEIAGISRPART